MAGELGVTGVDAVEESAARETGLVRIGEQGSEDEELAVCAASVWLLVMRAAG